MATIWVESENTSHPITSCFRSTSLIDCRVLSVPHPLGLNGLMTLCFAAMFAAGVANVYADPPEPGSFLSVLQDGDTQLFFCFWTSFLNGYIKTYIYSHVADVKLPVSTHAILTPS